MINYKKFLSTRFDLVIRYYFLEKVNFDVIKAKELAMSDNILKNVFDKLLTIDVKTNPHAAKKMKLSKLSYGNHVANQLFYMPNWLWIEENISNKWIKNNPYLVKIDGLGMSVKRFMISLKYGYNIYWEFKKGGKTLLSLWREELYKELLEPNKWKEIIKSKNNMIDKMLYLDFFSKNTYVGDKNLYEKYIRNLQT